MTAANTSSAPGRANALAAQDDVAGAFALLDSAARGGDALAAAELADWRLSGQLIRRNLEQARELYGRAADLGLDAARPVHIALLANGAGGTAQRDWAGALGLLADRAAKDPAARRQLGLLQQMALDDAGNPATLPTAIVLHDQPRVERTAGFLNAAECRYLIDLALPRLQPAVVVDPRTGQFVRDRVRNALCAAFPFVAEDPVLHAINRRIAAATATRWEQGEPLQVLSYQPGEEYQLHSDALPPGQNQRRQTLLVVLDDRFEGGETSFPRIGLNWRGRIGDALRFVNVDGAGRPEPLAWHAGLPVRAGRKFLLSKWIRENPIDLGGPPGRPF